MSDGIKNNLNLFLIKKILSEILVADNQNNINGLKSSLKHNYLVNFSDKTQVDDENSVFTKVKIINENITSTNSRSSFQIYQIMIG